MKLVLQVGQHDENFVDAYYGNPAWKPAGPAGAAGGAGADGAALRREISAVVHAVRRRRDCPAAARLPRQADGRGRSAARDAPGQEALVRRGVAAAVRRRRRRRRPRRSSRPRSTSSSGCCPGAARSRSRYAAFRNNTSSRQPRSTRCSARRSRAAAPAPLERLTLPRGETFTVEYVTGKSWSAYNWYKGNFTSVIQVNTDLPITIDRAIDLACHEGYPGHHVYNVLLERTLVRDRGWHEFSVYPLFSPQSLIAEGTANFGIEVAFPGEARTKFERETLYPLAGLDPQTAERYAAVTAAVDKLSYAGNEAARRYLNGEIDRAAAAAWLAELGDDAEGSRRAARPVLRPVPQLRHQLQLRQGSRPRVHREARRHAPIIRDVRWQEFGKLLSSPRLPSGLR